MATIKRRPRRRKNGRKGHYITGTYMSTMTGLTCKYRSGWELKFMEFLDQSTIVKTWGYESLKIPYVSNKKTGKLRTYYPDFRVEYYDGSVQIVEIKPSKRLKQVTVQKKIAAAKDWCSAHSAAFVIISEIELKGLGLLLYDLLVGLVDHNVTYVDNFGPRCQY